MACFLITNTYIAVSVPKYFFALAEELASRNHRVFVLVGKKSRDVDQPDRNPAILAFPNRRATHWQDAIFLHKLVNQHHPDCIIANFAAGNICTLVGWINRVPNRISWYHTMTKACERDSSDPHWKLSLLEYRKRVVYGFNTHLIAVSSAASRDAQIFYRVNPRKCSVLYPLIRDPGLQHREDNPLKVLCVGRLSLTKGQETLIRGVQYIQEQFPNVVFEFMGDGPEKLHYEQLVRSLGVEKYCRFLGNRPPAEVFEFMSRAAVCVTPSLNDAFPLVNVEAQSVGTPVVASSTDGTGEAILDGQTGFLVPPGNPSALAEKILLLLKNDDLRRKFSLQARTHFEDDFNIRNVSKHADFLEQLVNARTH